MEGHSRPATGYPIPNGQPPPPSATGYPYQAPPPLPSHGANPYYYNQPQPYPNPRATILRRIIAALIVVTVLFFTILFILWLVIRPHFPEFHATSLSLTNFNVSASSQRVTGNWNARFEIYNPNKKMKMSYDEIDSYISYKSEVLSETRIAPFTQDTKNLTTVYASYSALDTYVEGWVVKEIDGDRARGSVGFNLKLVAGVGFKVGGLRARRRLLRVLCENVAVGISVNGGSGNLTDGPRRCRVYG